MFPMALPIIMILVALGTLYFFFGRGGYRPPWWDPLPSGRETETLLDSLKKRYARGEKKGRISTVEKRLIFIRAGDKARKMN